MNANRHLPFWFPLLIVLAALQVQADDSQPRALIGKEGLEDWEPLEFGGSGEVLVKDGVLSIDEGVELSGVKFSKPESLPTSNYEIEFEARRTYGFDFFCALTFPVGDLHTCATLVVGGWGGGVVGISSIDNLDASENDTTNYIRFEDNKWEKIRLRVTDANLQGWLRGNQIFNEDIQGRKVSLRPGQIDMCAPFGIATFQTTGEIRNLTIRNLTEEEIAENKPAERKPNIVMILVDDLGYGDLSSYGAKDLQSPHIDALMEAGMRFGHFYANCCVCSPTRASLLTGRYPDRVGVPGVVRTHAENSWGYMDPHAKLIPDILEPAGYTTALVGKWHLGLEAPNTPHARGFDFFHGFVGDMMDDYYKHERHGVNYMRLNDKEIQPEGHATDLFTDWAIQYVESQAYTPTQPFFLYLAYNAPHTPIQPPADWLEKIKAREPGIDEKRAKLVALIEHMDHNIGRFVSKLKETGTWENTLLVFSSDNGGQGNVGANNGNLRGAKQDMYEGGIRVPTCAVWPAKIEAGSTSDLRGITMDLFPTFAEAAGASIDHEIEGISLLPAFLGEPMPLLNSRDLFFVRREGNLDFMGESSWAMLRGDWKLVKDRPWKQWELFNLTEDPLETTDLWSTKRPKIFKEITSDMRKHIQASGNVPWQE